jgi:hypothetical protein
MTDAGAQHSRHPMSMFLADSMDVGLLRMTGIPALPINASRVGRDSRLAAATRHVRRSRWKIAIARMDANQRQAVAWY